MDRYRDFIASAKLLVKNKAKQDYKLTLDEQKQFEFVKRLEGFGLDAAPQGGSYTAIFSFLLEWYAQYQLGEIESSLLANPENNARELTERYRRYLNSGKRVLGVSHGEGSIINNAAFDSTFDPTYEITGLSSEVGTPSIEKKKQFSSAHISPASGILSQGSYRTYDEDKYYNDIFSKLNFHAPTPNFSYNPVPLVGEEWLHDFSKTYMAIGVSGGQFSSEYFGTLGGVIQAAELLESNCSNTQALDGTYTLLPQSRPANADWKFMQGLHEDGFVTAWDYSATGDIDNKNNILYHLAFNINDHDFFRYEFNNIFKVSIVLHNSLNGQFLKKLDLPATFMDKAIAQDVIL